VCARARRCAECIACTVFAERETLPPTHPHTHITTQAHIIDIIYPIIITAIANTTTPSPRAHDACMFTPHTSHRARHSRYILADIRGDRVGWFSGDPCHDSSTGRKEVSLSDVNGGPTDESRCWNGPTLELLMRRLGTLVQMVASQVPECHRIGSRSEAMVTCYPGDVGARYARADCMTMPVVRACDTLTLSHALLKRPGNMRTRSCFHDAYPCFATPQCCHECTRM
jgi:hypothetical protein